MLSRKLKICMKSPLIRWNNTGACPKRPDYGPLEVQRSALMNGVKVVAVKPMGNQIAACTIMFQAGSRYEVDDQLGATHFIRAMSNASGRAYTTFSKMRALSQNGCYITCTSDRQTLAYSLLCPMTMFCEMKYYLLDAAMRCCFLQHEVDDRKNLILDDLASITPEQRALDLVQRASWAGSLSNSMFCVEERVNSMSAESLCQFVTAHYKSNLCSIASVGVPLEDTLRVAEQINNSREPPPPRAEIPSRARSHFEYYDLGPGSDTWIALAVPGCGTKDLNVLLSHAVIAAACGTGPMQTGQHHTDRTLQAPLGLIACDPFMEYRAFNISYKGSGLFGILVKSPSHLACNAAYSAKDFLCYLGDLNYQQLDIGKQRLKLDIALNDEDCVRMVEGFALQAGADCSEKFDSAAHVMSLIDNLSLENVLGVAKELCNKRYLMSVAVVGDLEAMPDDKQLFCADV